MRSWLRAAARFFQDKIGWNRIGLVLSLTIIGVALVVLYRILHNLDIDDVMRAIRAISWSHIALAALFVRVEGPECLPLLSWLSWPRAAA